MANTPNFALYKPNRADTTVEVDVSLADNFDKIDTELKTNKDGLDTHKNDVNAHDSDKISHADGSVRSTLENHEERLTSLQTDTGSLDGRITTAEGNIVTLTTDVSSLQTSTEGIDGRLTEIEVLGIDKLAPNLEGRITTLESDVEGVLAPATFAAMDAQSYTFDEYRLGYVENRVGPIETQLESVESSLAQRVTKEELTQKLDSPKVPLKLSRIPSFASGETMFNATAYVQDNLTTFGNNQYVIFTDQERRPVVGKRTLPDGEWTFFVLSTLLNNNLRSPTSLDEHNVYSIAVDKTGYIHICGNMHANVINYIRSKYPENIGEWEGNPGGYMTGIDEDISSYPHFVKRKDGELLFFYRNYNETQAITAVNIYNAATKTWSKLVPSLTAVTEGVEIDNPYFNRIAVGKDGTIHFSGCFRMNGYNADIFYMKSTDGGVTWKKSDGTVQPLPMTHANAEIAKAITGAGNGLLNQNGMEVDSDGNPHTVYFRKDGNGYTNIYHLYHNGTAWVEKQITNLKKTLSSDLVSWSGEMSRPSIFTVGKRVFIIYRVNYGGLNGTVRMVEVTPSLAQPVDFPILNIDLYAWEPTFDTQALYERNELHMLVVPCTTDYARYNNLTQLDNWKEQFLGVLSLDLNQIDKVIRKEVVLPGMRLVRSIAGGSWTNATAAAGAISFGYPQIPLENNSDNLFIKLSIRARGYANTKFYLRVKDVRLPAGNVLSYNSVLFDTASSTNKESAIRPLSTYSGMQLIEIEGLVELLNGITSTNIAISSVTLDIYKIVY